MLKKIGTILVSFMIATLLAFLFMHWYFLLTSLPDPQVLGTATPAMSKEEARDLMNYHGVKVIQVKNGEWTFERDGKTISLARSRRDLLRSKN